MKTKNVKKMTCLLSMALILCLSLFGGCKKREAGDQRAKLLLSTLPEKPWYSSLPVIGTQWKLVGFVNTRDNIIELAKPSGKETFLLRFKNDGGISGMASTNRAGGTFTLEPPNKLTVIYFGPVTLINELFDGPHYIEAMNKVSSYRISSKGLFLYYGKDSCLLFYPVPQ